MVEQLVMAVASLFLVLLVFRTSRCVPDDCRQVGIRTLRSAQMLGVSFFTRNFGHYFYEPLVLCRVFSSAVGMLRQMIFWSPRR